MSESRHGAGSSASALPPGRGPARLAPDQQAVLSLLVSQGRTYAQVASLIGIDPAAVRARAQRALLVLAGPAPADLDRAEIERAGDYVIGQLSEGERIEVLAMLIDDPRCRAWARRLVGELAPFASGAPLPRVPDDEDQLDASPASASPVGAAPVGAPLPVGPQPADGAPVDARPPGGALAAQARRAPRRRSAGGWPGFAVTVATLAMLVAAIVLFVLGAGGSSAPPPGPIPASAARQSPAAPAATSPSAASTASGAGGSSQILAQVAMAPAAGAGAARGEVAVLRSGSSEYVVFEASHLPAPGSGHYVLWLYDSPRAFQPLGEVPSVSGGTAGPLQVAAPRDLASFHGVLLTLQSSARPTHPGKVVLRGSSSTAL